MPEETPIAIRHQSVLTDEVLELLAPRPGMVIVDATLGVGGHARLMLEKMAGSGKLIGIDRDPEMLAIARRQLAGFPVEFVQGNFEDLPDILQRLQAGRVDAILADLGFCSDQMADARRGLSFQQDGPLDMRLDASHGDRAADLVRRLREEELADIFWRFGEERYSRRIARKIVETRKAAPLETTAQLAELVRSCVPRQHGKRHAIDPATRVFQALRIAVNDELGALERLLKALPDCLKPGGRAAIISFHSLEDRLVKHAFRQREVFEEITRKPRIAAEAEVRHNPRARSAKLRVAQLKGPEHGTTEQRRA